MLKKRGKCTQAILPQAGLREQGRGSAGVWVERLKLPIHCPFCWLNVKKKGGAGRRVEGRLQGYICSSKCCLSATKSKQSSQCEQHRGLI